MRARLRDEHRLPSLDAYRRAGGDAYALVDELGESSPPYAHLCAWNAFALQTIGDKLVDVDAAADPATAGYVPRATAQHATVCFADVGRWLAWAREAAVDATFRPPVSLPADLPEWRDQVPATRVHVAALRGAWDAIGARAETACASVAAPRVRRVHAAMTAAAESAEALGRDEPVLGEVERQLRDALELAYHLGQLAAVPELARTYEPPAQLTAPRISNIGDPVSWLLIEPGWEVVDCDARHVGSVEAIDGDQTLDVFHGLRVRGGVRRRDLRVEAEHVASITRGRIQLDVRADEL